MIALLATITATLCALGAGVLATDYAILGYGLHPALAVAGTFVIGIAVGVLQGNAETLAAWDAAEHEEESK